MNRFNIQIKINNKNKLIKFLKENKGVIKYVGITKDLSNLDDGELCYSSHFGGNYNNLDFSFHRFSDDIGKTKKLLKSIFMTISKKGIILTKENTDEIIDNFFDKNSGNVEINNQMWKFHKDDVRIECRGTTTKQTFTISTLSIIKDNLDLNLFLELEEELSKIIDAANNRYDVNISLPLKETLQLIELNLGEFEIEYSLEKVNEEEIKNILEFVGNNTAVIIKWGNGDINWMNIKSPGYNYLELYLNQDGNFEPTKDNVEIVIDINYKLSSNEIADKISKKINYELELVPEYSR